MIRRNIMGLLICIATLSVATLGFAGIPHLTYSTATSAAGGQVSVFVLPNANGDAINAAQAAADPNPVDATVTVTLLDGNLDAVVAYPYEDITMSTTLGGLVGCTGGTVADFATNAYGETTFSTAFNAGGFSASGEMAVVLIDNLPLVGSNLNILFNSADLDASGLVDLSDTVTFSSAFQGAYDYMVDYYFDGILNLSDLVFFTLGLGTSCP